MHSLIKAMLWATCILPCGSDPTLDLLRRAARVLVFKRSGRAEGARRARGWRAEGARVARGGGARGRAMEQELSSRLQSAKTLANALAKSPKFAEIRRNIGQGVQEACRMRKEVQQRGHAGGGHIYG